MTIADMMPPESGPVSVITSIVELTDGPKSVTLLAKIMYIWSEESPFNGNWSVERSNVNVEMESIISKPWRIIYEMELVQIQMPISNWFLDKQTYKVKSIIWYHGEFLIEGRFWCSFTSQLIKLVT